MGVKKTRMMPIPFCQKKFDDMTCHSFIHSTGIGQTDRHVIKISRMCVCHVLLKSYLLTYLLTYLHSIHSAIKSDTTD